MFSLHFILWQGLRLRMSEVAIATALHYYHTFQSTMEKDRFDSNVRGSCIRI